MAESLSEIFERMLGKQQILVESYHLMEEKVKALTEEKENLEAELTRRDALIEKLKMDNEYLRIARQLSPDKQQLEQNKAIIAKLVRDVDKCIEQLNE